MCALIAEDAAHVVARGIETALEDAQHRDSRARVAARQPGLAASVFEHARGVHGRAVEFAVVDHQAEHVLCVTELAAVHPLHAPGVAVDVAARSSIRRLRQTGALRAVATHRRVEIAVVHRQRAHGIAVSGSPAVFPSGAALKTIDVPGLACAALIGAGVERSSMYGQAHDALRVAGPAVVGPVRLYFLIIYSKEDVAPVALRGGHAGRGLNAEVQAAPRGPTKLA